MNNLELYVINLKKNQLDWFSPICLLLAKTLIWVNLILSMFNEIGWIRMLKCCLIDDWLDQFDEKVFGTFFPNLLVMAENLNPNVVLDFEFFVHWMTCKSFGDVEFMFNLVQLDWIWFGHNFPLWPRHLKHEIGFDFDQIMLDMIHWC